MSQLLDCLVSYFSLNEDAEGLPRRYFCYHIVAGPGPTPEGGVASISTQAVHDGGQPCGYCQMFHAVKAGGPSAALARALAYLDAYHEGDRLRKVQSEIRGLVPTPAVAPAPA